MGKLVWIALGLATATPAFAQDLVCDGDEIGAVKLDGNLLVTGVCTLDGTSVRGNVTVEPGGDLVATNVLVRGNVDADGASNVVLDMATVSGDVTLNGLTDNGEIVDSTVEGSVTLTNNVGPVAVTGTRIGNNLQADDNTGGVTIEGNRIRGNLQCQGNVPAPVGGTNQAKGGKFDQCAAL